MSGEALLDRVRTVWAMLADRPIHDARPAGSRSEKPAAREALAGGTDAGDLPFGSIVVKENYMPDSSYAAATVMYRVDD